MGEKMSTGAKVGIGIGVAALLGGGFVAWRRGMFSAPSAPSAPPGPAPLPAGGAAPAPAATSPITAAPTPTASHGVPPGTVRHAHKRFPPGPLVTIIGGGKIAQSWTVAADGTTLTATTAQPATPELIAQAKAAQDAAQPLPRGAAHPGGTRPGTRPGAAPARGGAPPAQAAPSGGASPFSALPGLPGAAASAIGQAGKLLPGGFPALPGLPGASGAGDAAGAWGGGGEAAATPAGGGIGDLAAGDPIMAGAADRGWRMVDPAWRPVVVRAATADDLKRQGWTSPAFPGDLAKIFRVPGAAPPQGWVDLGGRTAVGFYYDPDAPERGAYVGDSPATDILPTITNGIAAGYPVDPLDWSKGIGNLGADPRMGGAVGVTDPEKVYRMLRDLSWPGLLAWGVEDKVTGARVAVDKWRRFTADWEGGDPRPREVPAQWENMSAVYNLAVAAGYEGGVG